MKFKFGSYEKMDHSYNWWFNFIDGRNRVTLSTNTYVELGEDNLIRFYYHGSNVLTVSRLDRWQYSSCGWSTSTTKKRIYQLSPMNIWQSNYMWFYNDDQGCTQEFTNDLILDDNNRKVNSLI